MSYGRGYIKLALPIALVLACAACSPTDHDQSTDLTPAAPATATAPDSAAMNPAPGGTAVNDMRPSPGSTSAMAGEGDFNALAGAKGYMDQSDAMKDHWTHAHFQQCDTDHDGKLTSSEYKACRARVAPSQQPPSATSNG